MPSNQESIGSGSCQTAISYKKLTRVRFLYLIFVCTHITFYMNQLTQALTALFERIPRRHSLDNLKEINSIIAEYEDLLKEVEATNSYYEKNSAPFFEDLDTARTNIKLSTSNKASKKNKDDFFDQASGILKDSMQALLKLYGDGSRTAE